MAKLPSSSFALDFLRRLLCAHTTGGNAPRLDAPGRVDAAPEPEGEGRSPCIVARLMGLDAMPPPPAQQPEQILRRSRSASSVEPGGTSPQPCGIRDAAPPPSVRPSASLREKPAYLRAENDMYLLLSFSPEENREAGKKDDYDVEAGCRHEDRQGGERPGRKQRRPHRRKLQFGDNEEEEEEELGRRRRRGECCNAPQSSSPVSVLEAHEDSSTTTTTSCSLEDVDTHSEEAPLFASEQQSSSSSSARRRTPHCTTSFVVHLDDGDADVSPATTSTAVHTSGCRSDRERGSRRRRTAAANRSDASTAPDVSGVWQPVCRLVEEDLIKSTEWLQQTRRHGASNAAAVVVVAEEMGSEILEQLVCEATDELVRLCSDAPCDSPVPSSISMSEKGKGSGSKKHSGRTKVAGY